jgi:hypothetical protein
MATLMIARIGNMTQNTPADDFFFEKTPADD